MRALWHPREAGVGDVHAARRRPPLQSSCKGPHVPRREGRHEREAVHLELLEVRESAHERREPVVREAQDAAHAERGERGRVRRDRLQARALAASERRNRLAATIAEREALLREMERELAEEEETVSAAVAELSVEEDVVSQLGREASGWPLFTAAVQHFRNGGRRDAAFVSFVETALLAVGVPVDWATFHTMAEA